MANRRPCAVIRPSRARAPLLLLTALITAKLGLFIAYVARARWVMDEFGQGYASNYLGPELYRTAHPIKTVLPLLLLRVPLEVFDSATEILAAWRVATLLAALAMTALIGTVARRLHDEPVDALLAVFTALSVSNYFERAADVRNDTFAVLCSLAALHCATGRTARPRANVLAGIWAGAAFLCTQKSVYHLVALGAALLAPRSEDERRHRDPLARATSFSLAVAATVLVYAFAFGGLRFTQVLRTVFLSPLDPALLVSAYHGDLRRYVLQTLGRNPVAYAACLVGLGCAIARWRALPASARTTGIATAIVAVLVFLHAQSWPYVFVMAIPYLALCAPFSLRLVGARWREVARVSLALLLSLSFARNVRVIATEDKKLQFEVIRQAEKLLGPKDRYFDGIGMLPNRQIAGRFPWWWWDAPTLARLQERWHAGDRTELARILLDGPKLWILNYRLRRLAPIIEPVWRDATVRVSEHLLLSGRELPAAVETRFLNLAAGPYALRDAEGHPLGGVLIVDGRECAVPCSIGVGVHLLRLARSDSRAFVLPADFAPLGPLPYRGSARDLFAAIYDF